jgi:hypothetical protein
MVLLQTIAEVAEQAVPVAELPSLAVAELHPIAAPAAAAVAVPENPSSAAVRTQPTLVVKEEKDPIGPEVPTAAATRMVLCMDRPSDWKE